MTAGMVRLMRTAIMAMTMSNSMSVKAARRAEWQIEEARMCALL